METRKSNFKHIICWQKKRFELNFFANFFGEQQRIIVGFDLDLNKRTSINRRECIISDDEFV